MIRISAVPAGTRRRMYFPSGRVVAKTLVFSAITRAACNGAPELCAVTVPVIVPPCAPATAATVVSNANAPLARLRSLIGVIVTASLDELGGTRGDSPRLTAHADGWRCAKKTEILTGPEGWILSVDSRRLCAGSTLRKLCD